MQKRISIKDIASAAKVSTATVSLVLTGKDKNGRVSQEVAEKIRSIAQELNYQPNYMAVSLQSGISQTIGLLVTDISNPFFSSLAFHIQEEMEKEGYTVIIMNTGEKEQKLSQMITMLKNRQVDGFIIVPTEKGENAIRGLVNSKTPLVLIDRYYPDIPTFNVSIDNYNAAYTATMHLHEKGCRNIAVILYENYLPHMEQRKQGAHDALQELGILDESLIKRIHYDSLNEDIEKAISCFTSREEPVDGILFASNSIALAGMKHLVREGIKIEEDVHIVCFDKSDIYDFMSNFIPYLNQPIKEMGNFAAQLLLKLIKGDSMEQTMHQFPATLVRNSIHSQ